MNNRIYVGNLKYEVDANELAQHFEQAGDVIRAKIVFQEEGGRSKGFGFVDFIAEEDAETAIKMFHESFMHGRRLKVAYANKREKKEEVAA